MKRTITTQNRFITFTQSLLGKSSTYKAVLVVGLFAFFISCKDESGLIGFQKDPRLNAIYVDIPLTTSVISNPSILTDNPAGETITRILAGRYNDPFFGKIESVGFVNFAPPVTYTQPAITATFDSLVLQLNLDFYYYGQPSTTLQKLQVYEIMDTIKYSKEYYANSVVTMGSAPLAEKSFFVGGDVFDNAATLNADTDTSNNQIYNLRIKIPGSLGSTLLDNFKSTNEDDLNIFSDFTKFAGKYKGFALVMPDGAGDKILGINPVFRDGNPRVTDTKLSLYYTADGISTKADFVLYQATNLTIGNYNSVLSFSKITTDRTATALNGITPFTEYKTTDGRTYIQSGTSLMTKIDLKNFYNFIDTATNLAFNQAELVVNNLGTGKLPTGLRLYLLDSLNKPMDSRIDTIQLGILSKVTNPFLAKIGKVLVLQQTLRDYSTSVATDLSNDVLVPTDGSQAISNFYLTGFVQQLYRYRKDKRRPKALALAVAGDEFRKSVTGMVLDKNISLRIYYSKPVIKIQ